MVGVFLCFFFSSRRRHTRSYGDWSSDVCSSDLLAHRLALAVTVDRDRGLVAVLDRPDDVLRAEGGIAAEVDAGARRLEGARIDDRHVPFVELDAEIALDPREGVLLADREDHVVRGQELLSDDALGGDAPAGVELVFHPLEAHPGEAAVLDDELAW